MIIYEIVYVTNEAGLIVGTQPQYSRTIVFYQPQLSAQWRVALVFNQTSTWEAR